MYYSQIFPQSIISPESVKPSRSVGQNLKKSPMAKKWLKRFHTVTDINMGTLLTHSQYAEGTSVG